MSLNYPETQEDQEIFDSQIKKIADVLVLQEANNDTIKTICKDLKDAYGSEPRAVRQVAKLVKANSAEGLLEEVEEIVNAFKQVKGEEE